MEKVDVGMKFGRLTVIGEGKREKGVYKWKCNKTYYVYARAVLSTTE